jgi:hypothetical protein
MIQATPNFDRSGHAWPPWPCTVERIENCRSKLLDENIMKLNTATDLAADNYPVVFTFEVLP